VPAAFVSSPVFAVAPSVSKPRNLSSGKLRGHEFCKHAQGGASLLCEIKCARSLKQSSCHISSESRGLRGTHKSHVAEPLNMLQSRASRQIASCYCCPHRFRGAPWTRLRLPTGWIVQPTRPEI